MVKHILLVPLVILLSACGGSSGSSDPDNTNNANNTVLDSDGDGVSDARDAFPNNSGETMDSDGDGIGDNADEFPNDSTEAFDSDNDGVGNNADAFPTDPTETLDSDGDGVGDNADDFPNDASRTSAGDEGEQEENDDQEQEAETDESAPNLPEQHFNYANIELPEHYTTNAFNVPGLFQLAATDFDNTPDDNPITDAGATLGRVLFYDKKLSANGTIACASCHLPEAGFSDSNQFSEGFEGGFTRRNSMGLANARFYFTGKFFWDERADTLEEQVLMPFQDEVEMGLTLEQLEAIVSAQTYYPELFEDAFGDTDISSDRIAKALAQFVRSMVSTTSRYDIARSQVNSPTVDFPLFTAQENRGKDLFFLPMNVNNGDPISCAVCHGSEAFVGSLPPGGNFQRTIASNIGLDRVSVEDLGVAETTGNEDDEGKFKVPSLRNIALTAPYMHDGRFDDLDDVLDFYDNDIENHVNLALPLVGNNGQAVTFNLNGQEKDDLIAFLETLTDETMINDEKFSDPFQGN